MIHPIPPPPELVQQWIGDYYGCPVSGELAGVESAIATRAAQWGADMELEACCEWLHWQNLATHPELIPSLRSARRPKPPSLKEQALDELVAAERLYPADWSTIRRALEQLDA
jgi:hypothetical protein